MSDLAAAAVDYAKRGISVFPLQPGQKKPYGDTPGFHGASSDPELAAAWWAGRAPLPLKPGVDERRRLFASASANVGIATGEVSGFWVFDLDGPNAEAALQALIDVHGALPETVEQRTGAGRHLCFAWDPRFNVRNSASVVGPNIDVRGNGGYIVAPPSIHPGDPAKGIPPGRQYAWCARRAPGEIAFAMAPDWLMQLVAPPEKPAEPAKPFTPQIRTGRASRWGEACLNSSCRSVAAARPGKLLMSVFGYSAFIGGLVAGGEIERAYAKEALIRAGFAQAAPKPWTEKRLSEIVENGLTKGELHPQTAPERRAFEPAARRSAARAATPAEAALDLRDVQAVWYSARDANCGAVRDWFKLRGLSAEALPAELASLRAHPAAPIGGDARGPALLIPLSSAPLGELEALAVIPLRGDHERPSHFVGDPQGRVALLTPGPCAGDRLVALDLQDLWALGSNAAESGHDMHLVLAPTISAFAGGYLGDRYGRVDPETPFADPDRPPWTAQGNDQVWLAVRGDLRTPELRTRRTWGGTQRGAAHGDLAGRFYAGLAEQAWRRAGASKVHILRSSRGVGFSQRWGA